jgi:hypothetical protein
MKTFLEDTIINAPGSDVTVGADQDTDPDDDVAAEPVNIDPVVTDETIVADDADTEDAAVL